MLKELCRVRQTSQHWMRHMHGRKFVEAGDDRTLLRQNPRQAGDASIAIYDWLEVKRRRREVEKVFGCRTDFQTRVASAPTSAYELAEIAPTQIAFAHASPE